MKILKIFVLMVATGLLGTAAFAHQSKVGFINPQRIIMESKIGKVAQDDLARLGQEKDQRIRKARDEVEAMKFKLETGSFSPTEAQDLERSFRIAARDYEQLVDASSMDLQGEERRLIKFIMRRADGILKQLAKEMGFTMILTDPESIGYVDYSMDLTDRVIRELDSMK